MKRAVLILLAVMALSMTSCKNTKKTIEDPFTDLIGELDPKWEGDSIRIIIQNGVGEEYSSYEIRNNKFEIPVPTNKMNLGGFVISYDGGLVGRYFIPEGGTIRIHLDPHAKITVVSDKENSLTKQYRDMTEELEDLKYGMVRENNAKIKELNLSDEQADSLRAIADQILMDKIKEQALKTAKTNRDNILGVLAILNLYNQIDERQLHSIMKKMSPEVLNHPAIRDSINISK